jgi:hypothetical protein
MVEETSQVTMDSSIDKPSSVERVQKQDFWDRLGMGLSSVCAIHCLLVPVFVSLIPLWSALEHVHEFTHLVFLLAIAPTVVLSLKRLHANRCVSFYLISGTLIIFLAWFFNSNLGEYGEAGVTLIGSLLLITGHWINYREKLLCKI